MLPKAIAGASLLAYLVVAKYVKGLPVHRLEQAFAHERVALSHQTMNGWLMKVGERLGALQRLMLADIRGRLDWGWMKRR